VTGLAPIDCVTVPYFWSDQHGVRIQFSGFLRGDEEIIECPGPGGSLYLYAGGDTLHGVLAFERRAEFVKIRAMLRRETTVGAARDILSVGA
jgi:hypothetical protein